MCSTPNCSTTDVEGSGVVLGLEARSVSVREGRGSVEAGLPGVLAGEGNGVWGPIGGGGRPPTKRGIWACPNEAIRAPGRVDLNQVDNMGIWADPNSENWARPNALKTNSKQLRRVVGSVLSDHLSRGRYEIGALYPTLVARQDIPPFFTNITRKASREGCGEGLFARRAIGAGELVCIVGGLITSVEASNEYSLELWAGGPIVGDHPTDDPYTWWGAMNDHVWGTLGDHEGSDRNNVLCAEGGVVTAARRIKKGEELFLDYGPAYDWDPVKWILAGQLKDVVNQVARMVGQDIGSLGEAWALAIKPADIREARRTAGLPKLLADFMDGDLSSAHHFFPEKRDNSSDWLATLLRCRAFIGQYSLRGCQPSRRMPLESWLFLAKDNRRPRLSSRHPRYSENGESLGGLFQSEITDHEHRISPLPGTDTTYTFSTAEGPGSGNPQGNPPQDGIDSSSPSMVITTSPSVDKPVQDSDVDSLRVMSYNVNSLDLAKTKIICDVAVQQQVDVLVLVDTRNHSPELLNDLRHHIRRDFGEFSLHHCPSTIVEGKGLVGGVVIVTTGRLTNSKAISSCPLGSFLSVKARFGGHGLFITGVYVPCLNRSPSSFWGRIKEHYRSSPNLVLSDAIMEAADSAHEIDAAHVISGDFNTSMLGRGHARSLDLAHITAEAGLHDSSCGEDKDIPSFYGGFGSTRIDHQLHNARHVLSCTCRPFELRQYPTDHWPLLGTYLVTRRGPKENRGSSVPIFDISTEDHRRMEKLKNALDEYQMPLGSDAGLFLEQVGADTVALAKRIFGRSKRCKGGWSPQSAVLTLNLRKVITISRHISGARGHAVWTEDSFKRGMRLLLRDWRSRLEAMSPDEATFASYLNWHAYSYGFRYWDSLSLRDVATVVHSASRVCQGRLHGRMRRDRRLELGARVRKIEAARLRGKISSLLAVVFGRKKLGYRMEYLETGDGEVLLDRIAIHAELTRYFHGWFARPSPDPNFRSYSADSPSISAVTGSWRDLSEPLPQFLARYSHLGIPEHLTAILWTALQPVAAPDGFADTVSANPTIVEFKNAIQAARGGSAPGLSGLSYSMIKLWPERIVVEMYSALTRLWNTKSTPEYWKWRWLVPIPKAKSPSLLELRPLSLIEALRKIWFSIPIRRIQEYWSKGGLRQEQHGFRLNHSTDGPILTMINTTETAKDFGSELYVGSWDWRRAFDSVPKQLLIWGWIRQGVPPELAEYLVEQDTNGHTVVRSPFATHTLATGGRQSLLDEGLTFTAERGAGQGDVASPANWNAVYDILLTALEIGTRDEHRFFTQSHTGQVKPVLRTAFADDLFSMIGSYDGFQTDADIVSAFALFSTMTISSSKLRASRIQWGAAERPGLDHFVVRGPGWIPLTVQFSGEPFKHLGIVQSPHGGGGEQFDISMRLLRSQCTSLARQHIAAEAIWDCLFKKVYPQHLYVARFAPWRLRQFRELDKEVSKCLRTKTLNQSSFPSALLYIPRALGGLGFKRLSDLVHERKLSALLRLECGSSDDRHLAESLLGRALRSLGVTCSHGYGASLRSDYLGDLSSDTWWSTSLLEWLEERGLTLFINGPDAPPDRRPLFLVEPGPGVEGAKTTYQWLLAQNITTEMERKGFVTATGLSTGGGAGPPVPTLNLDIRPGQLWIARGARGLASTGRVVEIMGFVGTGQERKISVLFWMRTGKRRENPGRESRATDLVEMGGNDMSGHHRGAATSFLYSHQDLFGDGEGLLVYSTKEHTSTRGTAIMRINAVSTFWPVFGDSPSTHSPLILTLQAAVPGMAPLFSDGSWATTGPLTGFMRGSPLVRATAAVVTLYQGSPWGILITASDHNQIPNAHHMELVGVALAALLRRGDSRDLRTDCKAVIQKCDPRFRPKPGTSDALLVDLFRGGTRGPPPDPCPRPSRADKGARSFRL